MAARFSALVVAVQLLLAALAACSAVRLGMPGIAAAAGGVASLYVIALMVVGAAVVVARPGAWPDATRSGAMRRLRVLCAEPLELDMALLRMAAEPRMQRSARSGARRGLAAPAIVLVHGIACNRAVWQPLLARLGEAGFGAVHALNLEPLFGDIDVYALDLSARIAQIKRETDDRPVVIVAHSMGGLVARAALRHLTPGTAGRIVTVATPHHGTALACRFGWICARQMCPGSPWLRALNGAQEGRFALPLTSLYSLDDNLIIPASSAVLRGARSVELRGVGHLGLLRSAPALRAIVAELRG